MGSFEPVMKIFLVYPTLNILRNYLYSYGLGYIAAQLKKHGHQVNYFYLAEQNDIFTLYTEIQLQQPDIIGFSAVTSHVDSLEHIITHIKKISRSFVIIGGPHPTLHPDCISEIHGIDAIVRGEGEFPMLELANAMESGKNYLNIKNFWFKTGGSIKKNDIRHSIGNLDSLPFPEKSGFNYQKLLNIGNGINRFVFSRGCTFECTFCSNKALSEVYRGRYYRLRSPQKAIEEIEKDAVRYNFRQITLDDDTINLDRNWFYEFFNLYKDSFTYPFNCNVRADIIDHDMIGLLNAAGAIGVYIGVEHGNENFRRKYLNRSITNSRLIETFQAFDRFGIKCVAQLMVGLPFEDRDYFRDTVKLCRELPIGHTNNIHIFYPYPCTELGKTCIRNGWIPAKNCKERNEAPISYPSFSKSDIQLCRKVFPILVRFPWIPLKVPFALLHSLSTLHRTMARLKNDKLKKLVFLTPRTAYKTLIKFLKQDRHFNRT